MKPMLTAKQNHFVLRQPAELLHPQRDHCPVMPLRVKNVEEVVPNRDPTALLLPEVHHAEDLQVKAFPGVVPFEEHRT